MATQEVNQTLKNLDPDTRYIIRVRTVNPFGVASEWSEALDYTTAGEADSEASSTVVAGAGLYLTNDNEVNIGAGTGIQVNDDSVQISPTYSGQTSITTLGTITAGTWHGGVMGLTYGGTGANNASDARDNLGLGDSATKDVGTTTGTVAAGDHNHSGVYEAVGVAAALVDDLSGVTNAATARTNLGLGSIATQAANNVAITGGSITGITDLAVADGGTGGSDAATARTNLGAVNIAGDTMTGDLSTTALYVSDTDGTGFVDLAMESATPSYPSSGHLRIWGKTRANREDPMVRYSAGAVRSMVGMPYDKSWLLITPQNGTSVRTQGIGNVATTAGTISHPASTSKGFFAQSSQSNAGFSASITGGDNIWYRGTAGDPYAGFYFHARFYLPDASYDNTGASTGSRINVGVSVGSMAATDRHTGASAITFNRCNVNAGATDTNWYFVTSDAANANPVDSGLVFTAQHVYEVRIWCPVGASTVYGQIDDITSGATSGAVQSSTYLPAAGTAMAPTIDVRTINATARTVQFSRLYIEGDYS